MINIWILTIIIICHWLFDFVFQNAWMAINKSKNNKALILHTALYTVGWICPMTILLGPIAGHFLVITFVLHTITDYITSRITTKLYLAGKRHKFFVMIGFDQVLHLLQLILTYYLLNKLI